LVGAQRENQRAKKKSAFFIFSRAVFRAALQLTERLEEAIERSTRRSFLSVIFFYRETVSKYAF